MGGEVLALEIDGGVSIEVFLGGGEVFAIDFGFEIIKGAGVVVEQRESEVHGGMHLVDAVEGYLVVAVNSLVEGLPRDSIDNASAEIGIGVVLGVVGVRQGKAQSSERAVG